MDYDFDKWIYELVCHDNALAINIPISLEYLVKAMWAINRDMRGEYHLQMHLIGVDVFKNGKGKPFNFTDHNNSEQAALQAALEDIFKKEDK